MSSSTGPNGADSSGKPLPLIVPPNRDDGSTHLHRQTIGYMGAALPVVVYIVNALRPTDGLGSEQLSSISAYYYSGAVAIFTGVLAALAVRLFTYEGFQNDHRRHDRNAAVIAGCAAVLVACFPTEPPTTEISPSWWQYWVGVTHYVAAVILFFSFIYFSVFLFPRVNAKTDTASKEKRRRNHIYYSCGLGMFACMVWAGIAGLTGHPIFWPEAIALELFALSWLTKGRAHYTAWRLVKRGARAVGLSR